MINDIQKSAESKMQRSLEVLKENLAKIRTGRAHTGLLDQVEVDYYGSAVPVSQVANVTLLDARTIGVKVYESNMAAAVEKAIRDSNLGLNPAAMGDVIRVPMPMLTEERRKDLIKVVRGEAEDGRVSIRNVRRDAIQSVKQLVNDKQASEDDERRAETEIQKLTDKYVEQVDKVLSEKEKELYVSGNQHIDVYQALKHILGIYKGMFYTHELPRMKKVTLILGIWTANSDIFASSIKPSHSGIDNPEVEADALGETYKEYQKFEQAMRSEFALFHTAIAAMGGRVDVTAVGDRYVLESMRANGYTIGGEQSGHIIFAEHATTGDGLITALQVLAALRRSGKKASELNAMMTTYPQLLVNVRVKTKAGWEENAAIRDAIAEGERILGSEGRGMSRLTRDLCDFTVRLPMHGKINSLNASVAGAILMYEVLRQRTAKAAVQHG